MWRGCAPSNFEVEEEVVNEVTTCDDPDCDKSEHYIVQPEDADCADAPE